MEEPQQQSVGVDVVAASSEADESPETAAAVVNNPHIVNQGDATASTKTESVSTSALTSSAAAASADTKSVGDSTPATSAAARVATAPKATSSAATGKNTTKTPTTATATATAAAPATSDNVQELKEKIAKLKSLLGRSAKAQREAKVELEVTQKRLDQALREIDRLQKKIDKLANRPTHMELLADFETNFDKALLSVGQPGGQDTAPPNPLDDASNNLSSAADETAVVDSLLMQELNDSRQRIEKLENLNAALLHRSSQLEKEAKDRQHERDAMISKVSRLELEKRMAVMEAEHATKAMEEKASSLAEMQMEIDLVTKASHKANSRAAQGEAIIKNVKTDRQHVQKLESQVQALQEWALASGEQKNLAQERVRILEKQLQALQSQQGAKLSRTADSSERILFLKHGSFVVGAGDVGTRVFAITDEEKESVKLSERILLRWKFDLLQEDATIDLSIVKRNCEDPAARRQAEYIVRDRLVTGGAAGETENAFAVDSTCTMIFSNQKAWIRPKTVKYTVEAIVVAY